ncbi:MAG: helix-turn-helix domain-containing protein [Gammaproteobacteria bacterium]
MDGSNLGRKIRELRKVKGLTLDELAERTESSKSYIWDLENKPVARPSGDKLGRIARELGVTPEFLLDDNRTDVSDAERKEAFFRKYEAAKPEVREKLNRILDVLDDEQ